MNNLIDSEASTGSKWAKTKGGVNHELIMLSDFENGGSIRRKFIIVFCEKS